MRAARAARRGGRGEPGGGQRVGRKDARPRRSQMARRPRPDPADNAPTHPRDRLQACARLHDYDRRGRYGGTRGACVSPDATHAMTYIDVRVRAQQWLLNAARDAPWPPSPVDDVVEAPR